MYYIILLLWHIWAITTYNYRIYRLYDSEPSYQVLKENYTGSNYRGVPVFKIFAGTHMIISVIHCTIIVRLSFVIISQLSAGTMKIGLLDNSYLRYVITARGLVIL